MRSESQPLMHSASPELQSSTTDELSGGQQNRRIASEPPFQRAESHADTNWMQRLKGKESLRRLSRSDVREQDDFDAHAQSEQNVVVISDTESTVEEEDPVELYTNRSQHDVEMDELTEEEYELADEDDGSAIVAVGNNDLTGSDSVAEYPRSDGTSAKTKRQYTVGSSDDLVVMKDGPAVANIEDFPSAERSEETMTHKGRKVPIYIQRPTDAAESQAAASNGSNPPKGSTNPEMAGAGQATAANGSRPQGTESAVYVKIAELPRGSGQKVASQRTPRPTLHKFGSGPSRPRPPHGYRYYYVGDYVDELLIDTGYASRLSWKEWSEMRHQPSSIKYNYDELSRHYYNVNNLRSSALRKKLKKPLQKPRANAHLKFPNFHPS